MSKIPVVEFLAIDASEAYLADHGLVTKLIDLLKKEEGFIKAYHGFQQEDSSKAYVAIVWETYEHHEALMKSAHYGTVVEAFMALLATPKSFIMSHFETDPTTALEAPTTEVAFITLNDLKEKDALTTELEALNVVFQSVKGVHLPWALAFAREVPEKAFMLIGWDNAEAHIAAVYGPGGPTDIVGRIGKLAGLSVHHASFKKV